MTVIREHKNDYAKGDSHLYGFDGSQWVSVDVTGDGQVRAVGMAWDANALAFVPMQVNSEGKLEVAATVSLPSGAATSVSQESLNSLIETLQELVSRLAVLASWQQSSAAAIRVYNAGGTYTVSGPATSAQVIAALLTQTKALEQYSANAVHSNINNATGA